MKKQTIWAVGAALCLASGSVFAGTATFSGLSGDVDTQLPGVTYGDCSFVLAPGASTDVASLLGVFPLISSVPGTITVSLVGNETPGGSLAIELGLRTAVFEDDGTLSAKLSSSQVWLERTKAGITQTLGAASDVAGVTTIQFEITDTNAVLSYHDGNGFVQVESINLANVGTDTEDLTADRILNLRLRAQTGGPAWNFNRVVWTGDAVPDTNTAGCDEALVPDVVGLSITDATQILQDAGFIVDAQYDGNVNALIPGEVLSQNPVGGTLHAGTTVVLVVSGVFLLNDTDNDGLDDDWEMLHFGNLDQGPWDDPDGDRSWNIREFQNGTDPNNPESLVPVADYRGLLILTLILGAVGVLAALRMGRGNI